VLEKIPRSQELECCQVKKNVGRKSEVASSLQA